MIIWKFSNCYFVTKATQNKFEMRNHVFFSFYLRRKDRAMLDNRPTVFGVVCGCVLNNEHFFVWSSEHALYRCLPFAYKISLGAYSYAFVCFFFSTTCALHVVYWHQ